MASKKAKSKKAAKAKVVAKPRAKRVFEIDPKVLDAAKKELANKDQSKCEAIRKVAKRYGSKPRGELEAVFVGKLGLSVGTVRRQIQEGRTEA